MEENFITYFDQNYLPKGLCLYNSLIEKELNFILWIICTDETTYNFFEKSDLKYIRIIKLKDIENNELLKVKINRTRTEYLWTITSFCIDYVLNNCINTDRITYVDADIFFFKNPKCIFDEFERSKKDVLITKHSYSPELDLSNTSGQFCVQFIIFKKGNGQIVLNDWKKSCLNWCYAKFEDGKFGDQMYLDEWPIKFKSYTHVLQRESFAMGPWNVLRYPFSDAIFFHFHGLKIINQKLLFLGLYNIPRATIDNLYKPYIKELKNNIKNLNAQNIYPSDMNPLQFTKIIFKYYLIKIYNKFNLMQKISNKILRI